MKWLIKPKRILTNVSTAPRRCTWTPPKKCKCGLHLHPLLRCRTYCKANRPSPPPPHILFLLSSSSSIALTKGDAPTASAYRPPPPPKPRHASVAALKPSAVEPLLNPIAVEHSAFSTHCKAMPSASTSSDELQHWSPYAWSTYFSKVMVSASSRMLVYSAEDRYRSPGAYTRPVFSST
jgi:hypothetical protein